MANLILVRHGKSEWNQLGLWTGHTEVDLIDEGVEEARLAGEALKGITVHHIHVSDMRRTEQTAQKIKEVLGLQDKPHTSHPALKERHYGVYTGKNKWQVKDEVGDEEFKNIRRGWDVNIPEGESLKDVYTRVSDYYEQHIKPLLQKGENVLVVAHGNSLRALAKHVENLTEEEVVELEIGTGEILLYHMDEDAKVLEKEVLSTNPQKGKV